ncbi:hypothetical protein B0A55_05341 [Friedmanniomyces simplex]|uniref:Uncharacterized protein n=1 Tax=Friedmanniomyces simplex TaxID=329884 RepID=A0A4U0XHI3_9PEZI|nr:hypothetical protein B0A55_05341 [Friedmanniomyces simplex]
MGSMGELQTRIRTRSIVRDAQIALELTKLAKARDDHVWLTLSTDRKAERDPERLVRETFNGRADVEPLVLKVQSYERARVHAICKDLGLEHESTDAPVVLDALSFTADRWLVLGLNAGDVFRKVADIRREARRRQAELEEEREAAAREREAQARARHAAVDLTGDWTITCPYLEEHMDGQPAELSMRIWRDTAAHVYPSPDEPDSEDEDGYADEEEEKEEASSRVQQQTAEPIQRTPAEQRYYATFDFSVVAGIMRISGPVASGKQKACAMTYRWRGRETGERVIEVGSDERLLEIAFSERGTTLSGDFEGDCVGKVSFTGVKAEAGDYRQGSSEYEWKDLSARSYERECVGRWGRRF